MPQTLSQRRALQDINRQMQRAPLQPTYDFAFARKAKFFFIALTGSAAFVALAAATAYCCITYGI